MANRTRTHRNEFHLNDGEQYILDEKFRLSRMKSKSALPFASLHTLLLVLCCISQQLKKQLQKNSTAALSLNWQHSYSL